MLSNQNSTSRLQSKLFEKFSNVQPYNRPVQPFWLKPFWFVIVVKQCDFQRELFVFASFALGLLVMSKCSFCMSQNSQRSALNWLAGQVRVLLKKMKNLENGQSKVPIALDALVASSPATVQGGRAKICGQVASVFPEYIVAAPVASYATPASISFAAPAPVVGRISPRFYSVCRT